MIDEDTAANLHEEQFMQLQLHVFFTQINEMCNKFDMLDIFSQDPRSL